jgi:hypothetical protein
MISELDLIIRESLKDLVDDVFDRPWFGREREVVSLYAFGYRRWGLAPPLRSREPEGREAQAAKGVSYSVQTQDLLHR